MSSTQFEWRVPLGAWRWLILGALGASGAATAGCSGEAGSEGTGGTTRVSACGGEVALEGGFSRCDSGLIHRVAPGTCSAPGPLPETIPSDYIAAGGSGAAYACTRNADCTEKPYGACVLGYGSPYCSYRCVSDADCAQGELCQCDDVAGGGVCVGADCGSDAECGSGSLCAQGNACDLPRFVCQLSSDECAVDADCPTGQECELVDFGEINPLVSPAGLYRACRTPLCPIPGRPFLVDGVPRVADGVERGDWCSRAGAPTTGTLGGPLEDGSVSLAPPAELCAALGRGWMEQGLMEHASVAAFARFALQLLGMGAPPELVAGAAGAMQDEIRHAQDCFRLAQRYTGVEQGPGALPLAGAHEPADWITIVVGTVREGCIGETLAALEAAEALQHCEDAAARPVLERIAREEAQHAELAWRFVAWALRATSSDRSLSAALQREVRAAFAEELCADSTGGPITAFDRELARYGLLSAPVREALRARALREVVAPGARALLDAHIDLADVRRAASGAREREGAEGTRAARRAPIPEHC